MLPSVCYRESIAVNGPLGAPCYKDRQTDSKFDLVVCVGYHHTTCTPHLRAADMIYDISTPVTELQVERSQRRAAHSFSRSSATVGP